MWGTRCQALLSAWAVCEVSHHGWGEDGAHPSSWGLWWCPQVPGQRPVACGASPATPRGRKQHREGFPQNCSPPPAENPTQLRQSGGAGDPWTCLQGQIQNHPPQYVLPCAPHPPRCPEQGARGCAPGWPRWPCCACTHLGCAAGVCAVLGGGFWGCFGVCSTRQPSLGCSLMPWGLTHPEGALLGV